MAITLNCNNENIISPQEYVDFINANTDFNDADSIIESAPMLRALANNRELVVDIFNKNVGLYLAGSVSDLYTPQSFMIAVESSAKKNFYVRGNIWVPVSGRSQMKALEERTFSYNIAHDHDFQFMTVGYFGEGYETHIYENESTDLQGYIGEHVPMRLLEKTTLPFGKVMLYRPFKDIHIQIPPNELSISLNLMNRDKVPNAREQYFYDVDRQLLAGYPYHAASFNRCSLIQMASYVGNANTVSMLVDIAKADPLPRSRVTALEGLMRLVPAEADALLKLAAQESNGIVRTFASTALTSRENGSEFDQLKEKLGLGLRSEVSTLARGSLAETIR
jgi:hypothetical protein